MTFGAKRPRPQLQKGLDRDVYLVLKKLEDTNDGRPFKTPTAVYEAIKGSNSSLSRQKKRPLEDSIDRVFQYRKEELGQDSSDSEAALEEPPKPDDDRFLLNRQMTKHWHQNSTTAITPAAQDTTAQNSSEGARSTKKRRVQEDGDERAKDGAVTPKGALTDTDAPAEKQTKTPIKKTQKSSRYKVEHPSDAVQIGGVSDIYVELCKQTHPLLKRPESCQAMRKVPGILLSGPPGTGKRSLIRFLASKIDVPIVSLTECLEDPERLERSLNDAVEEAMRLAPCIVLIEQLDWYMSKPGSSSHSDSQRRNVVQFRRQMRRIEAEQDKDRHILAMATTSQITDVDPEVLRTGLFERTIQMRIPDAEGREDILRLLTKDKKLSDDVNFKELAKITHGFVGADILNVLTLAEQVALERYMDLSLYQQHLNERFPTDQPLPDLMELEDTQPSTPFLEPPLDDPLTREDFKKAIKDFVPSLRKDGFTVVPNITWDQVGALQAARRQLELSIIGPIRDPNRYRRHGLRRPAGCLLWGPPGCGKTLVAQAVANEAQASFILINGPELLNKYVGESERAVRELFNRARSSTPCILFFDEMDSLVPKRDNASTDAGTRVVNALLTELDGVQDRTGVYVIGTTNRPDMIDPAMLRPGRLNVRLFLDLPSPNERVDILRAIYRTNHPDATPAEFEKLEAVARDPRCTDFSGADLGGLHEKAAESSLEREAEKPESAGIDEVDWEYALSRTYRSVTNPETYRKLEAKMGKS